jgi:outer membrane murein-binding lipoprotein Lpp
MTSSTMDSELTLLARASRRAALLSAVGGAMVLGSLIFTGLRLAGSEARLAVIEARAQQAQATVDRLSRDASRLSHEAAGLAAKRDSLQATLNAWVQTPQLPVAYLQQTPGVTDVARLDSLRVLLRQRLIAAQPAQVVVEREARTGIRFYYLSDRATADTILAVTQRLFALYGCTDSPKLEDYTKYSRRPRRGTVEVYVAPCKRQPPGPGQTAAPL